MLTVDAVKFADYGVPHSVVARFDTTYTHTGYIHMWMNHHRLIYQAQKNVGKANNDNKVAEKKCSNRRITIIFFLLYYSFVSFLLFCNVKHF